LVTETIGNVGLDEGITAWVRVDTCDLGVCHTLRDAEQAGREAGEDVRSKLSDRSTFGSLGLLA
jgi:hypothetical protein